MKKPFVFLLLAVLFVPCGLAARAQSAKSSKPLNLLPLFDKNFDAYEKVLGAPSKVERDENFADDNSDPSETRYYKYPGVVRIILKRGNNGVYKEGGELGVGESQWEVKPTALLPYVSYVEVQISKKTPNKWQSGLRAAGFNPALAKNVFTYADGVSVSADYKGQVIHWVPNSVDKTHDHVLWVRVKVKSGAGQVPPVPADKGGEPNQPAPAPASTDTLPTAEEIKQSIAPAWVSVPPAPAQWLTEDAWARRTDEYLAQVGRIKNVSSTTSPVATWRMLILFYPNTDSDYKTLKGETAHFTGSLSSPQIKRVQASLTKLSDVVRWHSDGFCDLQVTFKTIERPLTAFSGAEGTHQHPISQKDCRQEVDFYNGSIPYDSIIVLYNPGPIPQNLRGLGGGGKRGTDAQINYGNDAAWNETKPSTAVLGTFVHEWIHGLDNFFTAQGYETEKLHHLYNCRYKNGESGKYWHSAVLQGSLIHEGDSRYGHSRAVWMSGSPRHPAALFPCQLTAPLPSAVFPDGAPITLRWAKTKAPSGYRVRLYSADNRARPVMSQDTPTNFFTLPAETLKPGNYLWTVQARDGAKLSVVGESFELFIKSPAQVSPLQITGPHLPVRINGDGAEFRVDAGVSSPCGLSRVEAELLWPDGRTQSAWLHRRSPNEGETMWTGSFKTLPNTGAKEQRCTVHIKATDQAGRSNASEKVVLLVGAPVPRPNARQETAAGNAASIKLFSVVIPTQSDAPRLIQAEVTGTPISNLAGNVWAEITRPDGAVDYVAVVGRGWDEGWTGFTAPRQGAYYFPPNEMNKDLAWKITYFFSDPAGKVTRSDTQTLWQYRPRSKMDLFARSFDNLVSKAKWDSFANDGASATLQRSGSGGAASEGWKFTTTKAGQFEYSAQFYPILTSLQNGKRYTLVFEAKADAPSEMNINTEMAEPPYLNSGLPFQTIKLSTAWKSWKYTFTAQNSDNGSVKAPNFRRGLAVGAVWVRGVTLTEMTEGD